MELTLETYLGLQVGDAVTHRGRALVVATRTHVVDDGIALQVALAEPPPEGDAVEAVIKARLLKHIAPDDPAYAGALAQLEGA